jgi:ABC-type Fe3+-hydroxamate transport system substrate-binding protein
VPGSSAAFGQVVAVLGCVGVLAVIVGRWAPPLNGLELQKDAFHYGRNTVRTGVSAFPREAWDAGAACVRLPVKPHRIVSRYWSIDDFVYRVVPPERVVAVSDSAYERSYSNVWALAEKYKPAVVTDPERALRVNPDLVLVSSSDRSGFAALIAQANVPVYRMYTMFTTLDEVEEHIRLTAYLTGEDERGEAEARRFRAEIERARRMRPAGARAPRILGLGGNYSYGSETLFHDIVKTVGGINVGAEHGLKGYDSVNSELIARWNPEWIVAAAAPGKIDDVRQKIVHDPATAVTDAVREGHVLVFESRVFLPMSPYSTLLVTALAEALWR